MLLVFEKFTHAYLFQIALEIMWLPIQTVLKRDFHRTSKDGGARVLYACPFVQQLKHSQRKVLWYPIIVSITQEASMQRVEWSKYHGIQAVCRV